MSDTKKMSKASPWITAVDNAVARFTRDVLSTARKAKVPFEYTGNKGDRASEIRRTLTIDNEAVARVLRKAA